MDETIVLAGRARMFVETYDGSDYFKDLTLFLRGLLKVRGVLIARIPEGAQPVLVSEAFCFDGRVFDMFHVSLDEAVFSSTLKKSFFHSNEVTGLFNNLEMLNGLNANSFLGATLYHGKEPSGLVAVIDDKPLENRDAVELVLSSLITRTSREVAKIRESVSNQR